MDCDLSYLTVSLMTRHLLYQNKIGLDAGLSFEDTGCGDQIGRVREIGSSVPGHVKRMTYNIDT